MQTALVGRAALKFLWLWACSCSWHLHATASIAVAYACLAVLNSDNHERRSLNKKKKVSLNQFCHLDLRLLISSKTIHKCLHVFREHKIMKWEFNKFLSQLTKLNDVTVRWHMQHKNERKPLESMLLCVSVLRHVCGNGISISSKNIAEKDSVLTAVVDFVFFLLSLASSYASYLSIWKTFHIT